MTRLKAIAIAAIATVIFGSLAIGIAANTGSGEPSTTSEAVTTAPAESPLPPGSTAPVVQQPLLVDLSQDDDDDRDHDDDDHDNDDDRDDDHDDDDDRDDDRRGRDHEEDD